MTHPAPSSGIPAHAWKFLGVFIAVFFVSHLALSLTGLAPNVLGITNPTEKKVPVMVQGSGDTPVRIEIPEIGVAATIANPATTDVATLDHELLSGAVRYPGSALLGEEGTVLVFGHSSYLPVVYNKAFKAFNGVQELKEGDPIYVFGSDKMYEYSVEKVEKMNASTGEIPLAGSGSKLVLATCDSFGTKSDRFVVTAKLVAVKKQANTP